MSGLFPEQPLLFYPSLARRFGTDEALLLGVYAQYARHHGGVDDGGLLQFVVRRREWLELADFWNEERLAAVTNSLVEQGVIEAEMQANGAFRIQLLDPAQPTPPAPDPQATYPMAAVERPQRQTVALQEPAKPAFASRPLVEATHALTRSSVESDSSGNLHNRGPAPSFGGSTGWQRPKDDLERLFEQQELRNRQLHTMPADWQPNDTTRQMLQKQNIPLAFAEDCVDEFVAYWLERDRKESSWDHVFIRLVKKEWVKAQGRKAREARSSDDSTEASGERYQADSRAQRRERITDAVMDIHNTDW
ncbi:DnaT-like ssDNA-binding domain-containing protein [Motiliproteus sediminis]|uniref:DnaT-like ssDNA-binding domain-containing protein n=1 Tax=Motiliproteus sediminis TaxID=1468178 RepID=UPI001AF0211D|nr:DnaT-like ssDNA-binding domain-containing protein [Motiliproteus sediminis]